MGTAEYLYIFLVSLFAALGTVVVICLIYIPAVLWADRRNSKKCRSSSARKITIE